MLTAAGDADQQAALHAECTTDWATLSRVATVLRGQRTGTLPVVAPFTGPVEELDSRTCTLLAPLALKGHR